MALTPRKEEVAAVVEVLESGEHDDSTSMAKALILLVAELMQERDGYGVGISLPTDDLVLPHGPYHNIGDAKRVVEAARERGLKAFIAPIYATSRALPDVQQVLVEGACKCGHPHELHGDRMTTYTGKVKPMRTLGCAVFKQRVKCPCPGYEAR